MKIFRTVQRRYATLGVNSNQNCPFNRRILISFLIFGISIVLHLVYIFRVASDFMEYMECICSTSAGVITPICFAAIVFRKITLFKCIGDMEKLIETRCKYPKSRRLYSKAIRQIERLSEIVFMVEMKILLNCLMLPKCIVSFGVYFIIDSGRDSFELPIPLWFPFDQKNPIGYLVAFILEYIILAYEFYTVAVTLAVGIGAFWLAIATTKDIKHILHSISDKTQTNGNQSSQLKILLSEFVDAHGAVKQVENDFSDIFQPIIMSLFTWSLLVISGGMLIIQMEILYHGNAMPVFLNATVNGIIGFSLVFLACELGQRMSYAFDKINTTIDRFDWYLFPIEMKRMLPMLIAIAQQPVELECFGSITCCREVFRKIIHCAFSYFMVLRHLGY